MSAKLKIKHFVNEFFLGCGYNISKVTSKNDLRSFFEAIHPVAINVELIRIGGKGDGGYLVPNDLEEIKACFSPGVSSISKFEEHLAEMNIKSFMLDYSVDKPAVDNDLFIFEKKFLGNKNNEKFIRLEEWVNTNSSATESNLILQMDIEGAEFTVFLDTPSSTLKKFRIMVVEFHNMHKLFNKESFQFVKQVFDKILMDFSVVHIHPNNDNPMISMGKFDVPPVIEFTFYRKDLVHHVDHKLTFPHPLDSPNIKNKPNIVLPKCWQ